MQGIESCKLLQKNWPFSTRKGSKHINVLYFFVVDKIKNNEVELVFCPSKKMLDNYRSKLVQRELFYDHRNTFMGI